MAGGEGFEPPLAESESAVLPLDEPPRILFQFQYFCTLLARGEGFEPPLAESESAVLHKPVSCASIPALACPVTPGLGLPSTHS